MSYRISQVIDRIQSLATRLFRRVSPFQADLAIVCAIFVATMLLYAPSLSYPFVWFDSDDLLRATKYSIADLFSGVAGYQYYRPLIFTFWKVILGTWGSASAPMFHAYLIGMHILSGVLLYALVRELARSRWLAAMTAGFFIVYPFSYQAVTWTIAHQPPPMIFTLASLLIYVRARLKRKGWPNHVAAVVCLAAAMLLHESAFVGALLVALVEAYLVITQRVSRPSAWLAPYFATTLFLFVLYLSAAKSNPNVQTLEPMTGLYLLQGLIYPAAMLLAGVCRWSACESVIWLIPVGVSALGLAVVAWRANRTLLIGLLGVTWFALGVAPVWLGRDYVYVEYAPRLLYLASAGAVLALAAAIGVAASRQGWWFRLAVTALILLQGGVFVAARQPLYEIAFRAMNEANRAMFAPRQEGLLFVNTVELLAFEDDDFPLGWFGVMVSPWHNRLVETPHLRAEGADWVVDPAQAADTLSRSRLSLGFHGRVVSPEQFREALAGVHDVFRVEALTSPVGELHLFQVAAIERDAAPDPAFAAEWPGDVRLLDAGVEMEAGTPVLRLEWAVDGVVGVDQTVFVHVSNAAGEIVYQADGDPIGGMAPFSVWTPGTIVRERRPLIPRRDLPTGMYTVAVGLYHRATLERIAPTASNLPMPDDALIVGTFGYP